MLEAYLHYYLGFNSEWETVTLTDFKVAYPAMWKGEFMDHLVLFCRESQEGENIHLDMFKSMSSGGSVQQEKQKFPNACWEVKSYHASSYLSIEVPILKDSHHLPL